MERSAAFQPFADRTNCFDIGDQGKYKNWGDYLCNGNLPSTESFNRTADIYFDHNLFVSISSTYRTFLQAITARADGPLTA